MSFRSKFDRLNKWHEFWVLLVFSLLCPNSEILENGDGMMKELSRRRWQLSSSMYKKGRAVWCECIPFALERWMESVCWTSRSFVNALTWRKERRGNWLTFPISASYFAIRLNRKPQSSRTISIDLGKLPSTTMFERLGLQSTITKTNSHPRSTVPVNHSPTSLKAQQGLLAPMDGNMPSPTLVNYFGELCERKWTRGPAKKSKGGI